MLRKLVRWSQRHYVALVAFVAASVVGLVESAVSMAATNTDGTDLTPVVTGFTGDLTNNLPIILSVLGGLVALGVALRFFTRHSNAR